VSEPRRFSEGGGSELERLVVSSVHDDAPSPEVRRRVSAALGLGAGLAVTTATTSALGASKGATAGISLGLTKWIAVAAVTGLTAAGTAVYLQSSAPTHDASGVAPTTTTVAVAPARTSRPLPSAAELAPQPSATPSAATAATMDEPPAVPSAVPSVHVSAAVAPSAPSLGDELHVLDDARAALGAGDNARAMALLDRHDHEFAHPALAPEAMALRIEVYARRGDHAGASRLASQFLRVYGNRPEAQHVRSILDAQQAMSIP
jgi:hypothetical protein